MISRVEARVDKYIEEQTEPGHLCCPCYHVPQKAPYLELYDNLVSFGK